MAEPCSAVTTPDLLPPELATALGVQMDALPLDADDERRRDTAVRAMGVPALSGVEPVSPTLAWDWHTAITGTTDPTQYYLLDSTPEKAGQYQQFTASGIRMSKAYGALVGAMVSFPDPDALEQARAALTTPVGNPADTPNPPGWTKVPDGAGILRWQPDWVVSTTPEAWLAEVAGSSQSTTTLRIPVRGLSAETQSSLVMASTPGVPLKSLSARAGELQALEVTARAWGRVLVTPGDWFLPQIPALAGSATFAANCSVDRYLGAHGLLRGQITGLLVAADPQVTLAVEASYWRRNEERLESADSIRIAGWSFRSWDRTCDEPLVQLVGESAGTVRLCTSSASDAPPQIAGIYIHPFRA